MSGLLEINSSGGQFATIPGTRKLNDSNVKRGRERVVGLKPKKRVNTNDIGSRDRIYILYENERIVRDIRVGSICNYTRKLNDSNVKRGREINLTYITIAKV